MARKNVRSDIPYKDRLLMDKYKNIRDHRNDAARVALKVACVALNDTEGLGYQRLTKFALRLQQLIKEYYDAPDVQEVHLNERLESMGFIIQDGVLFCVENNETGEIMPKKVLEVEDAYWQPLYDVCNRLQGWRCSHCKDYRLYVSKQRNKYKFCPNCGIRMKQDTEK